MAAKYVTFVGSLR